MTTHVRTSDAEREAVAARIQSAGGEGRLTLAETEERLAAVYAARYRHELASLTTDLPDQQPPRGRRTVRPLRVHAAIVVLVSTILIIRWVVSGVPFFFPAFPIAWLAVSLVIHAAVRGRLDWRRRVVSR
jgi:hypothetical protein